MPQSPLQQLRKICLALPESHEVEAWGEPTFRVKNKLFAMYADSASHHGGGRPGVWIKSTHVNQDLLVHADPGRYFKPPYVGPSGWVGVFLDKRPPWTVVADLLRDGYLLTAPKKLAAQYSESRGKSRRKKPRIRADWADEKRTNKTYGFVLDRPVGRLRTTWRAVRESRSGSVSRWRSSRM